MRPPGTEMETRISFAHNRIFSKMFQSRSLWNPRKNRLLTPPKRLLQRRRPLFKVLAQARHIFPFETRVPPIADHFRKQRRQNKKRNRHQPQRSTSSGKSAAHPAHCPIASFLMCVTATVALVAKTFIGLVRPANYCGGKLPAVHPTPMTHSRVRILTSQVHKCVIPAIVE